MDCNSKREEMKRESERAREIERRWVRVKVAKAMREAEVRAGAVGGEVERVLPRGSERVARLKRSIGVPRQRVGGLPPEASETKGV